MLNFSRVEVLPANTCDLSDLLKLCLLSSTPMYIYIILHIYILVAVAMVDCFGRSESAGRAEDPRASLELH